MLCRCKARLLKFEPGVRASGRCGPGADPTLVVTTGFLSMSKRRSFSDIGCMWGRQRRLLIHGRRGRRHLGQGRGCRGPTPEFDREWMVGRFVAATTLAMA